jgi:hypothetical protein
MRSLRSSQPKHSRFFSLSSLSPKARRAAVVSCASVGVSDEEALSLLLAATKRIRALGEAKDALGAVACLAELGASGVTPDVRAVTATLVRACL